MTSLARVSHGDLARPFVAGRASAFAFFGVSTVLFGTSAALTTLWSDAMLKMSGMPMPGGWSMSMIWMRAPGETWFGAATSFLEMWVVMMAAMMLPALTSTLWPYWQALSRDHSSRREWLTSIAGTAYFFVWFVIGAMVYAVGFILTTIEMAYPDLSRLVPLAVSVVVIGAGALQLSVWKASRLADCHRNSNYLQAGAEATGSAWRYGLRLGRHCGLSCANLMGIALVIGPMDLGSMALVTAAITLERLAPDGGRVARPIGVVMIGLGLFLTVRAALP